MPIKVTCQCGKSFAAKDELAGKAVKCPSCQQPLRIPAASPATAPAGAKPKAATRPAPAPPRPDALPSGGGDSLFDEVGLKAAAAGTRPCPGCAEPLAADAVVCLKCGYNTKLGRRMQTVKVGSTDPLAGGHSATTTDLMERAAQTMEEDIAEEHKKTREGLPWWIYLIGLVVLAGFLGTMIFLSCQAENKDKEKSKKGSIVQPGRAIVIAIDGDGKPSHT